MAMPNALRKLDNRVLGDRFRKKEVVEARASDDDTEAERTEEVRETRDGDAPRGTGSRFGSGDGFRQFLAIFYRIAALVFLLLAAICVLGIVFTLAPANEDNGLVSNVLDIAETVAGPFKDIFTQDSPDRELTINYGFAAVIYAAAAFVIKKLPGAG